MRIGLGYDIHRLVENRKLILGGIEIPSDVGLLGHSDADALIHAIIDAILGAISKRDIGFNFPDNDEKYKDINSLVLLKKTCELLKQENYKIVNIDSNIICQKIKLSNYIDLMRDKLSKTIETDINNISIKAKTNENLDSTGQGLSISTQAVVLIEKISL